MSTSSLAAALTGSLAAFFLATMMNVVPAGAQTPEKKPPVPSAKKEKSADKSSEAPEEGEKKTTEKPGATGEDALAKEKREELERDEKKAKWIRETLSYGINKDRKDAIVHIQTVKTPSIKAELVDQLVELLKTEYDSDIKVKALTTMGEIKLKKGIPEITKLLDDDSVDVRIAAVYALKNLEAVESKNILIEKLKKEKMDTDSLLIEALIITLGDFNALELQAFAREVIDKPDTARTVREKFVLFLGNLKSTDSGDFLLKLYKNEDEEVMIRCYAVNSLAKLGIKTAIPDIKEVLQAYDSFSFDKKKDYYSLSIYSVAALVKLGDPDATPRLMNSLKSDNTAVRLKAVELMKELKDKRTIDILKYKMKYDPNSRVQRAAREALKEMGVDVEEEKESKIPADQAGADDE